MRETDVFKSMCLTVDKQLTMIQLCACGTFAF